MVYLQFVQNEHKETPFLSGTIRVQSGRKQKSSENRPNAGAIQAMKAPAGAGSFPLKNTVPCRCEAIARQRTDYQNPPDSRKCLEFSYTGSTAFSSFPRCCLFLFLQIKKNLSVELTLASSPIREAAMRSMDGEVCFFFAKKRFTGNPADVRAAAFETGTPTLRRWSR